MAGKFFIPNGVSLCWNRPAGVTKAAISLPRSVRGICQNPLSKSNLVTNVACPTLSMQLSTRAMGYESDFATLFTLAGQVAKQEWYHQFLDKDTDIKRLANKINSYFVGLTDHFPPLCQGVLLLSVPDELLISEYEAYKSLSSLQTSKAVGPYNIPNRILKDFALELAPLVCDIYNQSLREGYIPALLKSSIVTPIPKVSPPALIEQDVRPISLTCTLAKLWRALTVPDSCPS